MISLCTGECMSTSPVTFFILYWNIIHVICNDFGTLLVTSSMNHTCVRRKQMMSQNKVKFRRQSSTWLEKMILLGKVQLFASARSCEDLTWRSMFLSHWVCLPMAWGNAKHRGQRERTVVRIRGKLPSQALALALSLTHTGRDRQRLAHKFECRMIIDFSIFRSRRHREKGCISTS